MDLSELGLSDYEQKVYSSLVQLGLSAAGEIASHSGVSYGRIYEVLYALQRKGLVEIVPEKTKKFIASNPKNLLQLIEKKEKHLEHIKNNLHQLKKFYDESKEHPVTMVIGKKNFYKVTQEQPKQKQYSYTVRYITDPHPMWMREHKENVAQGLKVKSLVRYDKETKKNVDKFIKMHPEVRKIPNEGIAMHLQDDDYMFIAMIKSNVTLVIRDKPFIKLMKHLFEQTYTNAETIDT
ncbi:TrmB family transcriptional regulator [Candidatus Woesearchaeota archaeon]|nr:MAG: TrmB family transcriptional regulator [Candidatus Woesearchaeota archaeon]